VDAGFRIVLASVGVIGIVAGVLLAIFRARITLGQRTLIEKNALATQTDWGRGRASPRAVLIAGVGWIVLGIVVVVIAVFGK